jgi:hypothetical protein
MAPSFCPQLGDLDRLPVNSQSLALVHPFEPFGPLFGDTQARL